MSEFLRDLLTKAKESADDLDTPKEGGELLVLATGPGDKSRGLPAERALARESVSESSHQAKAGLPQRKSMGMSCPSCDEDSVFMVNRFRLAGTAIGGTLGAIVGSYAGRATITVLMSAAGGPLGTILGAIFGATAGGWSGRELGKMIDEDMIGQYKCLKCGHKFYI